MLCGYVSNEYERFSYKKEKGPDQIAYQLVFVVNHKCIFLIQFSVFVKFVMNYYGICINAFNTVKGILNSANINQREFGKVNEIRCGKYTSLHWRIKANNMRCMRAWRTSIKDQCCEVAPRSPFCVPSPFHSFIIRYVLKFNYEHNLFTNFWFVVHCKAHSWSNFSHNLPETNT